jgi:hypothetical protein
MIRSLLSIAFVVACVLPARADLPIEVKATITGASHDLENAIVAVPMPAIKPGSKPVFTVSGPGIDGPIAHQFLQRGRLDKSDGSPELLILLTKLKAGQKQEIMIRAAADPLGLETPKHYVWHEKPDDRVLELRAEDRPPRVVAQFPRFHFDPGATEKADVLKNPTIKPYHHVFDAAGTRLTNGPEGKYPHHRGIFFGFNQVSYQGKKADVWHCRNGESQRTVDDGMVGGDLFGLHRLKVAWHGQDGNKFADEERELAFFPMAGGLLVDFRSRLTTDVPDGVKLDGDPQHAGFHFRANAAVEAAAKQTYFLRPDGKGKDGDERNWDPKTKKGPVNLPWDAMCFELDGKRRTVVYLDHPDNPKEARQSERTYGRIGTYFEYKLLPDKPLFVRYRLWIQDGEMTVEQCEALSRTFTEPVKVEGK